MPARKTFNAVSKALLAGALFATPLTAAQAQYTVDSKSSSITLNKNGSCTLIRKDGSLTAVVYTDGRSSFTSIPEKISLKLNAQGNIEVAPGRTPTAEQAQTLKTASAKFSSYAAKIREACAVAFPGQTPWTPPLRRKN